MGNRTLSKVLFGSLLLLSLAYIGYTVWSEIRAEKAVQAVIDRIAKDGVPTTTAETVDGNVRDLRAVIDKYRVEPLRALLMDQLWYQAWYYPERSVAPLQESISIGRKLYAQGGNDQSHLAYLMVFDLLLADLPSEHERWHSESLAQVPYYRDTLNLLLMSSRLLADDLPAARQVVLDELERGEHDSKSQMFAMAGYVSLNDLASAAAFAPQEAAPKLDDINVRLNYSNFLMSQEDFHSATQLIRESLDESPNDTEIEQQLATALIGAYGANDEKALAALKLASKSTRLPRSVEGAQALSFAQLSALTLDPQWLARLKELAALHPKDFVVRYALASACLDTGDRLMDATQASKARFAGDDLSALALQNAGDCRALAAEAGQQQTAEVLQARAVLHTADAGSPGNVAEALLHLARALGAPETDGAVESERVPEYDSLVLDKHVQKVRAQNNELDKQIHELVTDYLMRRRALFNDALRPLNKSESK